MHVVSCNVRDPLYTLTSRKGQMTNFSILMKPVYRIYLYPDFPHRVPIFVPRLKTECDIGSGGHSSSQRQQTGKKTKKSSDENPHSTAECIKSYVCPMSVHIMFGIDGILKLSYAAGRMAPSHGKLRLRCRP